MRVLLLFLLLWAGLLAAAPAGATAVCTAVADPTLPFGNINSNAPGPSTANLNITVTCTTAALSLLATTGVRVCVGIGAGSGGGSSSTFRTMATSTSDTMNFQLYNNASFGQVTGLVPRGTPPAQELTMSYNVPLLTGGSGAQTVQLFGQIPANQVLASGAYSSTFSGASVVLTWAWNEVLAGSATVPATCNGGATGTNSASAAFSFTATANVLPQCGSYVTTNMNFGNVTGGIPANIDQTATLPEEHRLPGRPEQRPEQSRRHHHPAHGHHHRQQHLLPALRAVPGSGTKPALGQHPDGRHGQQHRHRKRTAADHLRPGTAGHRPAPGRHLQRPGDGDDHLLTCVPTNGRPPPERSPCQARARRYSCGASGRYRAASL